MIHRKLNPHLVIFVVLLWAFFVTLLRGLRRPNDWAEAHWLISYKLGFVKRGLPGSLMEPFYAAFPGREEIIISLVSFTITIAFSLSLLAIAARILIRTSFSKTAIICTLVFFTSSFMVMSGHLNGYYDAQIILITIVAMWFVMRNRPWLTAITLSIGVFIHETILVIGLPVTLWTAFLVRETTGYNRLRDWTIPLRPFLIPAGLFCALVLFHSYLINTSDLEETLIAFLQNFAFIQHDQEIIVPRALSKSFVAHFQSQSPRFWGRLLNPGLFVTIFPSVLALLVYTHHILKIRGTHRFIWALALILPFIPLTLHLIAWDTERIWTFPIIVGFLGLWAATEATKPAILQTVEAQGAVIVGLIAIPINVFSQIPLMDWRVERFSTLWRIILYAPLALLVYWCMTVFKGEGIKVVDRKHKRNGVRSDLV